MIDQKCSLPQRLDRVVKPLISRPHKLAHRADIGIIAPPPGLRDLRPGPGVENEAGVGKVCRQEVDRGGIVRVRDLVGAIADLLEAQHTRIRLGAQEFRLKGAGQTLAPLIHIGVQDAVPGGMRCMGVAMRLRLLMAQQADRPGQMADNAAIFAADRVALKGVQQIEEHSGARPAICDHEKILHRIGSPALCPRRD